MPIGVRAEDLDLTAKGSLPAAWVRVWASAPSSPTLLDRDRGWIRAGELEETGRRRPPQARDRSRRRAARRNRGRAGEYGVPSRELAHIVSDARPKAALVDDPDRAGWVRAAAEPGTVVLGPGVDLPDREPVVLNAAAPDSACLDWLYVGDNRSSQGGGAHARRICWREASRLGSRGAGRRLTVSFWRSRCFTSTGCASGCTARCSPAPRLCFSLASTSTPSLTRLGIMRPACSLACPRCTTQYFAQSSRVGELAGFAFACPGRRLFRPSCARTLAERGGRQGARALRHDRDADERLKPLRRRAPGGERGVPPARRGAATCRRRGGRDSAARAERLRWILGASTGQHRQLPRRMVPHRGSGQLRPGRISTHPRTVKGTDHHWRPKRLPARGRRRAPRSSGRGRSRRRGHTV